MHKQEFVEQLAEKTGFTKKDHVRWSIAFLHFVKTCKRRITGCRPGQGGLNGLERMG